LKNGKLGRKDDEKICQETSEKETILKKNEEQKNVETRKKTHEGLKNGPVYSLCLFHLARVVGLIFQSSLDEPVGDSEGSAPRPWFHSTSNPCGRTGSDTTRPSQVDKSVVRSRHTLRLLK
jgi:hypothetical protein